MVNFWPKTDPDYGDMGLDFYWQISCPRSEQTLERHILWAAESVAEYLMMKDRNTLILCEAGKTRSVFFCILVVAIRKDISYTEAMEYVLEQIPAVSLKGFMLQWIKDQDAKER